MGNKYISVETDKFENRTYYRHKEQFRSYSLHRFVTDDNDILILNYSTLTLGRFMYYENDRFIIRLNDEENIELSRPNVNRKEVFDSDRYERSKRWGEDTLERSINKDFTNYWESYDYVITEDILLKMCNASTISIKQGGYVVSYDDEFINFLQIFYNGAYDSSKFTDAVTKRMQEEEQKEQEKRIKKEQEELHRQKYWWLYIEWGNVITGVIIIAFFVILLTINWICS